MVGTKEISVADEDNTTFSLICEFINNSAFKVVNSSNFYSELNESIKKRPPDIILLSATLDERKKDKYSP
ncbi:MAG: hypothetical protein HGB12_13410, partial [Bacteroidetes bacterium]|nr:hypothetical protein [Bacteroidota bacterium]